MAFELLVIVGVAWGLWDGISGLGQLETYGLQLASRAATRLPLFGARAASGSGCGRG